jgi:hypothetical protein
VDELTTFVTRTRHIVERHGKPGQQARFFASIAQSRVRRTRYRVDLYSLELTQLSLIAAEQSRNFAEITFAQFGRAFLLMLDGSHEDADPLFRLCVAGADRMGDTFLFTRHLAYHAVLMRMMKRVGETRTMAERVATLAENANMYDYLGAAYGNLAWVAWRQGDAEDVQRYSTDALTAWARLPKTFVYPFQWIVRLPYAAQLHKLGQLDNAVDQIRVMAGESQQMLVDSVQNAINRLASEARENVGTDRWEALAEVFSVSERAHYL